MKLLICLLLVLINITSAFAQDLGPIGPKAGGGSFGEKPSVSTTNLPYKPSGTEGSDVKTKSKSSGSHNKPAGTSNNEPGTKEESKEVVIPDIAPKYPPSVGAPDISSF
ncbi:MAG: hypothetical protein ACD_73C00700G0003 [uncultured bacterium]|nr:MAG: hypothetical protein ACD_73C00700G0003 [uncultured bacterium]